MAETAANIVAAASESYYRALQFEQENQNSYQLESGIVETEVMAEAQNVPKKRRGKPPKNKRNSPMIGTSLRMRRFTQVQNSPRIRGTNTRGGTSHAAETSRRNGSVSNRGISEYVSTQRPVGTIIPAISRATVDFWRPPSPIP
ncbi:unnamed protein product [Microthlaspi erraticum]|uniref:Uncharacterized protein n=1 Tax=Microthlaspi erraticum TaxID=1685480 RepID=A0A6D2I641_9BRAS|nr:unnamed protein product [Microthlaspi erraticum]